MMTHQSMQAAHEAAIEAAARALWGEREEMLPEDARVSWEKGTQPARSYARSLAQAAFEAGLASMRERGFTLQPVAGAVPEITRAPE